MGTGRRLRYHGSRSGKEERDHLNVSGTIPHASNEPASLTLPRRYPPIYTFLTTGIAGSVTTFSSWMLESYLAFSNFYQYDRGGLHDVRAGLTSRAGSSSRSPAS